MGAHRRGAHRASHQTNPRGEGGRWFSIQVMDRSMMKEGDSRCVT
jgi:hypothetical protein